MAPKHRQGGVMDFVEFMNRCDDYLLDHFERKWCEGCGGTGIETKRCCSGHDCGCQGQPVDFEPCECGAEPPEWFAEARAGR